MFLFPALISGTSDLLILYISYYGHKEVHSDEDFGGHDYIYNVSYVTPLAWMRLALLMIPLPYHAYTGTGVKYPTLYHVLYASTIVAVLIHMLCIIMLDPDSLNILLPSTAASMRRYLASTLTEHHTMSHIWILLSLTLWSNVAHVILLWHVRSTAPHEPSYELKRKQRITYYYAKESSTRIDPSGSNHDMDYNDSLVLNAEDDPLAAAYHDPPTPHNYNNTNGQQERPSLIQKMRCINDGYDDIMSEIQTRLHKTRQKWTERLDDFTNRLASSQNNNNNNNNDTTPSRGGSSSSTTTTPFMSNMLYQVTPFRVLLQLFAYEEVFTNHRLDHAFDNTHGKEALTFYVPQLLSFLLHGAFYNSTQLETWILQKCKTNIHFAHRCYWFLRAWCMEGSNRQQQQGHRRSLSNASNASLGSLDNILQNSNTSLRPNRSEAGNMSNGSLEGMMLGSNGGGVGETGSHISNTKPSKYHPEEESLIEALLAKVMECGEHPARILHHGPPSSPSSTASSTTTILLADQEESFTNSVGGCLEGSGSHDENDGDGDDFIMNHKLSLSSSQLMMVNSQEENNDTLSSPPLQQSSSSFSNYTTNSVRAVASGVVPIDPFDGNPSPRHLQTIAAKKKFGFIPLDDNDNDAKDTLLHTTPTTATQQQEEFFTATPRFLEALTTLADNLFLMPREKRTQELRKQLRALEVDLLPSNSIYVPIGNANHRVWRIVADESIAISTKERVPCIVCLEVVDYSSSLSTNSNNSKSNSSKNNSNSNSNHDNGNNNDSASTNRRKKRSLLDTALMRPVVVDDEEFFDASSSPPLSPRPAPSSAFQQLLSIPGQHTATERELIHQWKTGRPRDPQRHNSIFDKVTNYTQMGLRRLQRHSSSSNKNNNNDIVLWSSEVLSGGAGGGNNAVSMSAERDIAPLTGLVDDEESNIVHSNKMEGRRFTPSLKPPLPPGQGNYSTSSQYNNYTEKTYPPPLVPTGIESSASPASSRNNSRPSSPATTMGQWGSPTNNSSFENRGENDRAAFKKKRLGRQLPNENIGQESGVEISTAGMQRSNHREGNDNEAWLASSLHGPSESLYGATREPLTLDIHESRNGAPLGVGSESRSTSKSLSRSSTKPPPVVFKESWQSKEERIRSKSAFGSHPGWRLLPILIKSNDDLRQEQLASQLIYRMASILAREKVPVWLCPYEIVALTDRAGIIEAIPDTISIDSLKRNDPNYTNLKDFFFSHFGEIGSDEHSDAKANFVESLAAYSIVCFVMQIKDRHNGNIMLDKRGHLIHIDFGFFFLSSPGKNSGFESAPFKLTRDFVDLMDGPESKTFRTFRELCCRTFLSLRKNCYQITLLVEMLMVGNEDLACFRGRPEDAVKGIRDRFRLDLNDRACMEYVNDLVDESLENWRTRWYDRYQRYCVGVL